MDRENRSSDYTRPSPVQACAHPQGRVGGHSHCSPSPRPPISKYKSLATYLEVLPHCHLPFGCPLHRTAPGGGHLPRFVAAQQHERGAPTGSMRCLRPFSQPMYPMYPQVSPNLREQPFTEPPPQTHGTRTAGQVAASRPKPGPAHVRHQHARLDTMTAPRCARRLPLEGPHMLPRRPCCLCASREPWSREADGADPAEGPVVAGRPTRRAGCRRHRSCRPAQRG